MISLLATKGSSVQLFQNEMTWPFIFINETYLEMVVVGGVNGLQIGQVGKIVFRADNITHFSEHKSSLFLVYFVQYCFSIFFSNLKNLK